MSPPNLSPAIDPSQRPPSGTVTDLLTSEPSNFFGGRSPEKLCIAKNILVFARKTAAELKSHTYGHWLHHRYVLATNLMTRGTINIDGILWTLEPGEGILIFPQQFHSFAMEDYSRFCWSIITFELESTAILEVLRNRVFEVDGTYRQMLGRILHYYGETESHRANARLGLEVARLVNHLRHQAQADTLAIRSAPFRAKRRSSNTVVRIQEFLLQSSGERPTGTDIARALKVSPSKLRATFKEHYGINFKSYLKDYRLSKAVLLMKNPNLSLSDIAYELGFTSLGTFSRFFTQAMGESPSAHRRRLDSK